MQKKGQPMLPTPLATRRAGSAVIVHQADASTTEKIINVSNWASTLQVELIAMLAALKIIKKKKKNYSRQLINQPPFPHY